MSETQTSPPANSKNEDIEDIEEEETLTVKRQIFRSVVTGVVIGGFLIYAGVPALVMLAAFVFSILFHEAGHFFFAKKAGMKATEFFVGFGPKIFSFTKGETTYGLKLIPLGAYVKIIGMSKADTQIAPEDEQRTFYSKPFRWRLATVLGGPAANIVLGFFILLFLSIFIGRNDPSSWYIQTIVPDSPAAASGLVVGEQIVAVDEKPVATYDDFVASIEGRNGEIATLTLQDEQGNQRIASTQLGWRFTSELASHYKAFEEKDVVVGVNGEPVGTFEDFSQQLANLPADKTANVVFARGGSLYSVDVPNFDKPQASNSPSGFLGVSPAYNITPTTPSEGIIESLTVTKQIFVESVGAFKSIFAPSSLASFGRDLVSSLNPEAKTTGEQPTVIAPSNNYNLTMISGPAATGNVPADSERLVSIIGIFRLGTQAAEAGFPIFLIMWALINIFLAVVNLIPLLPFDGGHAAIAIWEKIRGTVTRTPDYRADITKLMPLSYTVIAFFVVLSLSAMWLDIVSPLQNPF